MMTHRFGAMLDFYACVVCERVFVCMWFLFSWFHLYQSLCWCWEKCAWVRVCVCSLMSVCFSMLIWQCVPWILATTAGEILIQSLSLCNSSLSFLSSLVPFLALQSMLSNVLRSLMGGVSHNSKTLPVPLDGSLGIIVSFSLVKVKSLNKKSFLCSDNLI